VIVKQHGVTRGLDRSLLQAASRPRSKSRDDCAKNVEMSRSILLGRLSSRLCRDVLRERCEVSSTSAIFVPPRYLGARYFSEARLKCSVLTAACHTRWPAAGTRKTISTYPRKLSTSSKQSQAQPRPSGEEVRCPCEFVHHPPSKASAVEGSYLWELFELILMSRTDSCYQTYPTTNN